MSFQELVNVTMFLSTRQLHSIPKTYVTCMRPLQYNKYVDLVGR